MHAHDYTDLEREVIVLKAVTDLIDDMVNYEMFARFTRTKDMNLMFNTMTHQRLFNVLLVDMLSWPQKDDFGLPPFPKKAPGSTKTFLYYLRLISQNPRLNTTGTSLAKPVEEFAEWLDAECCVENVWLPSINVKMTIRVSRMSFIKICGDIAKHSLPRMATNAKRIQNLLAANGREIDIEHAYLAMPDFYQWFHNNIFSYHSSAIGEFLNNIRLGIYDYLKSEFSRSYKKPDPTALEYRFDYPSDCTSDLAQAMYWELMNWVRATPCMSRFEVTKYHKKRY